MGEIQTELTLKAGPPWGFRMAARDNGQVFVSQVLLNGCADQAGLEVGDIIEKIANCPMTDLEKAHEALRNASGSLCLAVKRENDSDISLINENDPPKALKPFEGFRESQNLQSHPFNNTHQTTEAYRISSEYIKPCVDHQKTPEAPNQKATESFAQKYSESTNIRSSESVDQKVPAGSPLKPSEITSLRSPEATKQTLNHRQPEVNPVQGNLSVDLQPLPDNLTVDVKDSRKSPSPLHSPETYQAQFINSPGSIESNSVRGSSRSPLLKHTKGIVNHTEKVLDYTQRDLNHTQGQRLESQQQGLQDPTDQQKGKKSHIEGRKSPVGEKGPVKSEQGPVKSEQGPAKGEQGPLEGKQHPVDQHNALQNPVAHQTYLPQHKFQTQTQEQILSPEGPQFPERVTLIDSYHEASNNLLKSCQSLKETSSSQEVSLQQNQQGNKPQVQQYNQPQSEEHNVQHVQQRQQSKNKTKIEQQNNTQAHTGLQQPNPNLKQDQQSLKPNQNLKQDLPSQNQDQPVQKLPPPVLPKPPTPTLKQKVEEEDEESEAISERIDNNKSLTEGNNKTVEFIQATRHITAVENSLGSVQRFERADQSLESQSLGSGRILEDQGLKKGQGIGQDQVQNQGIQENQRRNQDNQENINLASKEDQQYPENQIQNQQEQHPNQSQQNQENTNQIPAQTRPSLASLEAKLQHFEDKIKDDETTKNSAKPDDLPRGRISLEVGANDSPKAPRSVSLAAALSRKPPPAKNYLGGFQGSASDKKRFFEVQAARLTSPPRKMGNRRSRPKSVAGNPCFSRSQASTPTFGQGFSSSYYYRSENSTPVNYFCPPGVKMTNNNVEHLSRSFTNSENSNIWDAHNHKQTMEGSEGDGLGNQPNHLSQSKTTPSTIDQPATPISYQVQTTQISHTDSNNNTSSIKHEGNHQIDQPNHQPAHTDNNVKQGDKNNGSNEEKAVSKTNLEPVEQKPVLSRVQTPVREWSTVTYVKKEIPILAQPYSPPPEMPRFDSPEPRLMKPVRPFSLSMPSPNASSDTGFVSNLSTPKVKLDDKIGEPNESSKSSVDSAIPNMLEPNVRNGYAASCEETEEEGGAVSPLQVDEADWYKEMFRKMHVLEDHSFPSQHRDQPLTPVRSPPPIPIQGSHQSQEDLGGFEAAPPRIKALDQDLHHLPYSSDKSQNHVPYTQSHHSPQSPIPRDLTSPTQEKYRINNSTQQQYQLTSPDQQQYNSNNLNQELDQRQLQSPQFEAEQNIQHHLQQGQAYLEQAQEQLDEEMNGRNSRSQSVPRRYDPVADMEIIDQAYQLKKRSVMGNGRFYSNQNLNGDLQGRLSPFDESYEEVYKNAGAIARLAAPEISVRRCSPSSSISNISHVSQLKPTHTHFHLPSHRLRLNSESDRPKSASSNATRSVKTPEVSWLEVEQFSEKLGKPTKLRWKQRSLESVADQTVQHQIEDKLDKASRDLDRLLDDLQLQHLKAMRADSGVYCSSRSTSSNECNTGFLQNGTATLSKGAREMKRLQKEEMLSRQRADKLTSELDDQRSRRHGYIPNVSPSLQNNYNRLDQLLVDFDQPRRPATSMSAPQKQLMHSTSAHSLNRRPATSNVLTCTVLYKFVAQHPRELSLNRGDVVRVHREVDDHWLEGERNGHVGIFPASYVQIDSDVTTSGRNRVRAIYPFQARNSNELSLKAGEILKLRREIDSNWVEGNNSHGSIGIFPRSYVRDLELDDSDFSSASGGIPDRPKTPKLPNSNSTNFNRLV
ncbi:unnamed protein product [Bursaphelenchus okinawaensis]|uniref:SH3 domain-containing protein n=1 Tax=Bursaphelenchus okinawaensis TaxID=465554 RepID=A0A811KU02_9BILA|nr:unnamed protein product [Bursaphelenchus okinawaensis]CAG9110711.1 unnamed protein product [Bursaphelenchus okinawaensis]